MEFICANESETIRLGQKLADFAQCGDTFALYGTLGMGKSVLARAFVQKLTNATEVPSPTFTLVQCYEAADFDIYHFDLYRLENVGIKTIADELREYSIEPVIADPVADAQEAKKLYKIEFVDINSVKDMDAVVLAVAHDDFKNLSMDDIIKMYGYGTKVLLDIKGLLNRKTYTEAGFNYWRL